MSSWLDVSSRRFEDGTEQLTSFVVRWFAPESSSGAINTVRFKA